VSYSEGSAPGNGQKVTLLLGENYNFEGREITFKKFNFSQEAMSAMMAGGDFEIGAVINIVFNETEKEVEIKMVNKAGERSFTEIEVLESELRLQLASLDASGKIEVNVSPLNSGEPRAASNEILTVEASIKPFIGLVWLGVIVTTLDFL